MLMIRKHNHCTEIKRKPYKSVQNERSNTFWRQSRGRGAARTLVTAHAQVTVRRIWVANFMNSIFRVVPSHGPCSHPYSVLHTVDLWMGEFLVCLRTQMIYFLLLGLVAKALTTINGDHSWILASFGQNSFEKVIKPATLSSMWLPIHATTPPLLIL